MPYPPFSPGPTGPLDAAVAATFLIILLVAVGAAVGIAAWIGHRHNKQQRHGHQH